MTVEVLTQTAVRPVGARLEVRTSEAAAASSAASWIAHQIRDASDQRAIVSIAFSGGRTPAAMFGELSLHDVPWHRLHVFQVDERVVPDTDPRRNAHQLRGALGPLLGDRLHLIPAGSADPEAVAAAASRHVVDVLGLDGVFDVVHLGLGDDGHTASLVPHDPLLLCAVASASYSPAHFPAHSPAYSATIEYQATRRVTLTYPILLRSRALCWLATGPSKAPMTARLLEADPTIPAGRLAGVPGVLFTDALGAPQ